MINTEQLLGKILNETLGLDMSHQGGKKRKKGKKKSGSLLTDALSNPTALMTAIGLGVGAYEIYKSSQKTTAPGPAPVPPGGAASGGIPSTPGTAPPPPPPPPPAADPAVGRAPASGSSSSEQQGIGEKDALRMIQVMIGAAHADGVLDEAEEKAILERLRGAELNQEEKMFLLDELHHPKTIAELADGVDDPAIARTMYMLAVAAIEIDSDAERLWLDELGEALGLSVEIRGFLEEQVAE